MTRSEWIRNHGNPYASGGGGVVLEHSYGAAFLACMLLGEPISGLGDDATPIEVRFQQRSTHPVDDLVVVGEISAGYRTMFVGVQRRPKICASSEPFVKLVTRYLRMLADHQTDFDSGRWRLALAVAGPQAATTELSELTRIARCHRDGGAFRAMISAHGATSAAVRARLRHLDGAVRAADLCGIGKIGDTEANDVTWRLLQALHVLDLRLEGDDAPDRTDVAGRVVRIVGNPSLADNLRRRLTELASRYAVASATVDKAVLRRALAFHALPPVSGGAGGDAEQDVRHQRELDMETKFIPATQWFTGRHRALTDVSAWLGRDDARAVVMTGGPGSGKTAVLGLLAALSDHERRPSISCLGLPCLQAAEGAIATAIHASTLPTASILAGIAVAAGTKFQGGSDIGDQVADIAAAVRDSEHPVVVLIDGLDESADPQGLVRTVLRPLIQGGGGKLRLLLGTRSPLVSLLGPSTIVIDLDDSTYADRGSCQSYARHILLNGRSESRFRSAPAITVDGVAEGIAEAAGTSFLVARIIAYGLAAVDFLPDAEDTVWRRSLPRTASDAMRQDLQNRLGPEVSRACDLLLPLAYAQGNGLPWDNIWQQVANGLNADVNSYTDADLRWLRREAGFYFTEGTDEGHPVFRLFHEALAEYLREHRDQIADHSVITEVLLRQVPAAAANRRDWRATHPYVRNHLATHAAHAGQIDDVLTDADYLLVADRARLLPALDAADSDTGRRNAAAYRRVAHHLAERPLAEHASYLELAARRGGAAQLADSLAARPVSGQWSCNWAQWQVETPHRILTRHEDAAHSVACFMQPDGRACVVSEGIGLDGIRVSDLDTGEPVWGRWSDPHRMVQQAVCLQLRNGPSIAVTTELVHGIRAWDLANDRPLGLNVSLQGVREILLAEVDGRPIAVIFADDKVSRWDVITGHPIGPAIKGIANEGFLASACAELSGSRTVAVVVEESGWLRLWDFKTGQLLTEPIFLEHPGRIQSIACAKLGSDQTVLLTAGRDAAAVHVWDLLSGQPRGASLNGHVHGVSSLTCRQLPDGRVVAFTGGDRGEIYAWDLATRELIGNPISGHPSSVRSLTCTQRTDGGQVVVSAGNEGTVRVWDFANFGSMESIERWPSVMDIASVASSEGQVIAATAGSDGKIRLWDTQSGTLLHVPLTGHNGLTWSITCVILPSGNAVAVSGGSDGTIRVWDINTGQPVGEPLQAGMRGIYAVACAVLPDGRTVVIGGGTSHIIRMWDLETRKECRQFNTRSRWSKRRFRDGISSLACHNLADGRLVLLSGSLDGVVRTWDLTTGRPLGKQLINRDGGEGSCPETSAVACLRLPTGQVVAATGGEDETLRVWELGDRQQIVRCAGQGWVHGLTFAQLPDGRPVLVSGGDMLRVWDVSYLTAGDGGDPEDWSPMLEIDLDAPIRAIAAGAGSSIVVGTAHGLLGMTLHSMPPGEEYQSRHTQGTKVAKIISR